MKRTPRHAAVVLLAAAAAIPAEVAAQSCGLAGEKGLAASVGAAHYDLVGGLSGAILGLDGDLAIRGAPVRAGYRRLLLDGPDADIGRIAATLPLPLEAAGIRLCASGHAGAARLPVEDEAPLTLAVGLGLGAATALHLGAARAVPYVEVRGLAAHSTGTLFGIDVGAAGLGVGFEGGIGVAIRRFTVRLAGSIDGLDDGLGVTPYPDRLAELAIGIRF